MGDCLRISLQPAGRQPEEFLHPDITGVTHLPELLHRGIAGRVGYGNGIGQQREKITSPFVSKTS